MLRLQIFLGILITLLIPRHLSAQNGFDYKCLIVDYSADSLNFNENPADSNINCIEINSILSSQMLNEIFEKITSKENIVKITLNNYSDKQLPVSFISFINLQHVIISSCPQINYNSLFRILKRMPSLTHLELIDNDNAPIPNSLKHLKKLRCLSVKDYDFVNADALFKNLSLLPKLKHLTLSSCGQVKLSSNCIFPTNLQSLDLSDNWLTNIPAKISQNKQLEVLDISENNFRDTRNILSVIAGLPLKSLKVSCYDIFDSLAYIKTFPTVELKLNIYRNFNNIKALHDSIQTQPTAPFIESYYQNSIKPVIGYPENERAIYPINNQKSNKLLYKTGSVINIPADAFTDANGLPVKSEIKIYYREFTDLAEILAHGIRLQYDSAGKNHYFQTAGMFEMFAATDNQEVFLAPGKKIQIDFSTTDTASGFNLYRLDNTSGHWQYNTPIANDVSITPENPNPAYRLYSKLINNDITYFNDRYKDTTYARTSIIPAQYYINNRKTDFPYFKIKRASKYIKDKLIKKQPSFYFDMINYGIYKELAAYRNYVWIYEGALDKKEFANTYLTRKKWTDIRVSYNPDDYIFEIELKNTQGFSTFKAWPYRSNMLPEREKYEKEFIRADKRYNKTLNRIQTRFDKKLDKKRTQKQKKIWEEIYKLMTPEEKVMSKNEWISYALKCLERERDSLNRTSLNVFRATRSFQIDGFGLWNLDKIYKMPDRFEFIASFFDALNNPLTYSTLYVIDNTDKTLISFPFTGSNKISIKNGSETAFFMVNTNGSIAIVDKNNVRNSIAASKGNNISFTAYEIDPKLLSTGDLRNLLGL